MTKSRILYVYRCSRCRGVFISPTKPLEPCNNCYLENREKKIKFLNTERRIRPKAFVEFKAGFKYVLFEPKWNKLTSRQQHVLIRQIMLLSELCSDCNQMIGRLELSNSDHKYSKDLRQWKLRCRSCHATHDIKLRNKRDKSNSYPLHGGKQNVTR